MKKTAILIILTCIHIGQSFGQITSPKTPHPKVITPHSTTESHSKTSHQNSNTKKSHSSKPNSVSFNRISTISPDDIFNRLNGGNQSLNAQSFIPPKQINTVQFIRDVAVSSDNYDKKFEVSNSLPIITKSSQRKLFLNAFDSINAMLSGKSDLSLMKAVFLTENAYSEGTLNYSKFREEIQTSVNLINTLLEKSESPKSIQNINRMIHKFMCDTIFIADIKSLPKKYDFDDPFGVNDVHKMFVSKLVTEGSGQCKSLPLLFLILCQELGGEAYLSFSPSHSFIKCKNEVGKLYNIELTNGMLTSDSWLVSSGYIKSQAVRSGIYLDTLNQKQVIANCLIDLAQYYCWKYGKQDSQMGYDDFSLKCINTAISFCETNINALLQKSNYYTALLNYLAFKKGYRNEEDILKDDHTKSVFLERNKMYALTDGLGYEYMPEREYTEWLKTCIPTK